MLKKMIASLDDVEEKYRALYTEQADGTFSLDVQIEGADSAEGLKNNNYELKKEKLKLQEKLDALEKEKAKLEEQDMMDQNKFQELLEAKTKAWEAEKTQLMEKTGTLESRLKDNALNTALKNLASELAGDRALLIEPHLKSRLTITGEDGDFKVQVMDGAGNPSIMTTEQLAEEFRNNAAYAPILKGRNSTGAGAGGDGDGAGSSATLASYEKYFNPKGKEYSPTKQAELASKDKVMHDELVEKYQLNSIYAHVK